MRAGLPLRSIATGSKSCQVMLCSGMLHVSSGMDVGIGVGIRCPTALNTYPHACSCAIPSLAVGPSPTHGTHALHPCMQVMTVGKFGSNDRETMTTVTAHTMVFFWNFDRYVTVCACACAQPGVVARVCRAVWWRTCSICTSAWVFVYLGTYITCMCVNFVFLLSAVCCTPACLSSSCVCGAAACCYWDWGWGRGQHGA
jgi:hypothetical protein